MAPFHDNIGARRCKLSDLGRDSVGLGLGGFFGGIVLHQGLQWHHMLTDAGSPATSVDNLKINTFCDGFFDATTYVFVVMGLLVWWRAPRRRHVRWSTKLLAGTLLIGFVLFNLVEGIVDHHLLGIHHVNETVKREQWIFWDVGFLIWGAASGGWLLLKVGQRETVQEATDAPPADHLGGRTRAGASQQDPRAARRRTTHRSCASLVDNRVQVELRPHGDMLSRSISIRTSISQLDRSIRSYLASGGIRRTARYQPTCIANAMLRAISGRRSDIQFNTLLRSRTAIVPGNCLIGLPPSSILLIVGVALVAIVPPRYQPVARPRSADRRYSAGRR
jgi:uncharacterized membrane protein